VFGTLSLATGLGSGAGPWVAGRLHDLTGDYVLAFEVGIAASVVSAVAIWLAAPRKVRLVSGRVPRGIAAAGKSTGARTSPAALTERITRAAGGGAGVT